MIRFSWEARQHVADLTSHFERRERLEAARNLRAAIDVAIRRIETRRGPFFPAPRPYPDLLFDGWMWLKEGRYWVAFIEPGPDAIIQAVFHESADIPGRVR